MRNVLVISPHPDDEAIGCGGTIRKHVLDGDTVEVVFLTSGEKGGHAGISDAELVRIREKESMNAKDILGVQNIEFWRFPDANLKVCQESLDKLNGKIKVFMPSLIFVPHDHEDHPDHRTAADLVRQVVTSLPNITGKPEVFMYELWTPIQKIDHIVDISDYVAIKKRAIQAYKSQCSVLKFDEAILSLNRYRGEMHSWPGGDYAEIFMRMNI
jgi:LmbE family N-acetylglucosaminyl deacetylase